MQIVIDIHEDTYSHLRNGGSIGASLMIENVIKNGTPLPKGHGRLIDEKEIDAVVNGIFLSDNCYSTRTILSAIHNQCIETVEADKAESED